MERDEFKVGMWVRVADHNDVAVSWRLQIGQIIGPDPFTSASLKIRFVKRIHTDHEWLLPYYYLIALDPQTVKDEIEKEEDRIRREAHADKYM